MRRTALLTSLLLVCLGWAVAVPGASADGPTGYTNTTSIAIPATGSPNQAGPADPSPSSVAVSGLAGDVSDVTVTLHNLTHSAVNDIDALLVGPGGQNLIVLSDIGDPASTLTTASNATLTLDDAAAGPVPSGSLPTGTYRPTNSGTGDTFPATGPTPSSETTFAGAFDGTSPNGTWQLYVIDDATGDVGSLAGGWSLTVTTEATAPTITSVTSSVNPSTFGTSVTFTATVTSAASPVTAGTVTFTDGATVLASGVTPDSSGQASLTTSTLAQGTHGITATYNGAAGFAGSSGSITQQVNGVGTSTSLSSSLNPSRLGDSVTFTATVSANGSPVETGVVQFSDGGTALGAPVPVAPDGTATLSTSALAVGAHPIVASYSGGGFSSSSNGITQVVDQAPVTSARLTLVKKVVNDGGGSARTTDWTLTAKGPSRISGVTGSSDVTGAEVTPGRYFLWESGGPPGYLASRWRCVGASYSKGLVKLTPGAAAVCTITNNDTLRGRLTLKKVVVNDGGGKARPSDWTLSARGPTSIRGATGAGAVTQAVVVKGWYTLSEYGGPAGYSASAWKCPGATVSRGKVLVRGGPRVVCTITNNDRRR